MHVARMAGECCQYRQIRILAYFTQHPAFALL